MLWPKRLELGAHYAGTMLAAAASGMVLAAAVGGRGPGPLVSSIAKEGVKWGDRKVPITIVPGDLTDAEIAAVREGALAAAGVLGAVLRG